MRVTSPLTRSSSTARSLRLVITIAVALGVSIVVSPARAAEADTITVCGFGCDHTTIQAAIDDPSTGSGDTIEILQSVHTEAGIDVDKSVTIVGAHPSGTTVQAHTSENSAGDRVFWVRAGKTVTIQDMTIRYGKVTAALALGGGILNSGNLTLLRVTVSDNRAIGIDSDPGGDAKGGGICNQGSLNVIQGTISGNEAWGGDGQGSGADGGDGLGGGIANVGFGGTLRMTNSTVSGNRAERGDGAG